MAFVSCSYILPTIYSESSFTIKAAYFLRIFHFGQSTNVYWQEVEDTKNILYVLLLYLMINDDNQEFP